MATADFRKDVASKPYSSNPEPTGSPEAAGDAAARLKRQLERLATRRNTMRLLNCLAGALCWGIGVAALGVLAYRFYLIDGEPWMPVALIVAAFTIGYRNGRRQRRGLFAAANDADLALGMEDRLSSALAFIDPAAIRTDARRGDAQRGDAQRGDAQRGDAQRGDAQRGDAQRGDAQRTDAIRTDARRDAGQRTAKPQNFWKRFRSTLFPQPTYRTAIAATPTRLVPALVHDAAARAEQIEARTLYPLRFGRPLQVLLGLSVLLVAFALMPNIEWFRSPQQRRLAKTLEVQGQELQALAKQVRRQEPQNQEGRAQQLAKRLESLGKRLQRGRMDKRTALLSIGQLKRDLEKAQGQSSSQATSPDMSRFADALRNQTFESPEGRQLQEEVAKGDFEKAAQQMEKLADKLEKGDLSAREREQAARDLEKTAKSLREQGGSRNEEAARQLEEAAQSLRERSGQGQQQQQQGQNGQDHNSQGQQGQKQGQHDRQSQAGGSPGQSGNQQQQQAGQGNGSAADALRKMAGGLRQGGSQSGNQQALRDMLNKIREAEKQTGSNSGEQSGIGKAQSGQGKRQNGQGESQGQSTTPGKDLQPTNPRQGTQGGAGLGPRNNIKGGQRNGGGVSDRRTNRTGDKRRWSDIWSDRLPKTRQKLDRVTGKMGNDGDIEQLPTRTESKGDKVRTPYYEVYDSYKKDAEDAIAKENVPPAYQQPVKEYFESLKP